MSGRWGPLCRYDASRVQHAIVASFNDWEDGLPCKRRRLWPCYRYCLFSVQSLVLPALRNSFTSSACEAKKNRLTESALEVKWLLLGTLISTSIARPTLTLYISWKCYRPSVSLRQLVYLLTAVDTPSTLWFIGRISSSFSVSLP